MMSLGSTEREEMQKRQKEAAARLGMSTCNHCDSGLAPIEGIESPDQAWPETGTCMECLLYSQWKRNIEGRYGTDNVASGVLKLLLEVLHEYAEYRRRAAHDTIMAQLTKYTA